MKQFLRLVAVLWPLHKLSAFGSQLSTLFRKYKYKQSNNHKQYNNSLTSKIGGKPLGTAFHVCSTLRSAPRLRGLAMVLCCISMLGLLPAQAQTAGVPNIKPLQIGDTIPEYLWNLPLQVVNHPEGRDTITLNDHKDKLIILDFWHTGCVACIKTFPKLDTLDREFGDGVLILPVTFQKKERIKPFLKKNPFTANVGLAIAIEDTVLHEIFPHRILPHIVWIGSDGVVRSSTPSEYVTAANIQKSLHTPSLTLYRKEDVVSYAYEEPIFEIRPTVNIAKFYAIIGGYMSGLPTKSGIMHDDERQITRYYCINHPILHLYALALRSNLPLQRKRRILEVDDPSRFVYREDEVYLSEWQKANAYTYEMVAAYGSSKAEMLEVLGSALNSFFGLDGKIESRKARCMVLRDGREINSGYFTKGGEKEISLDIPGKAPYMQNVTTTDLAYILNTASEIEYPIIDETSNTQAFDIELAKRPHTTDEWQTVLKGIGIDVFFEWRDLDMFVLSDIN